MPEGAAEVKEVQTRTLPNEPLSRGLKVVGDTLGFYGDHLVRHAEYVKRVSVGDYAVDDAGSHRRLVVVTLEDGQLAADMSIRGDEPPELLHVYQQKGPEGAPIIDLLRRPGTKIPEGDPIVALKADLGDPETVQRYEGPDPQQEVQH